MISDVDAFRTAWSAARKAEVGERPTPAVQMALDKLAVGIRQRVVSGRWSVEKALKPFQEAVATKGAMPSDPSTLVASTFADGDRLLVNVAMGRDSRVVAFDAVGNRLPVPPAAGWSSPYAGSFRRVGSLVMLDGYSIQDAGVRYGYRLAFLRRTAQGYVSAGQRGGEWVYDDGGDAHLRLSGTCVTVRTLDAPKAFFISNPERLLRREETWDAREPSLRRVSVRLLDPDMRAVDGWLLAHRGGLLMGKRRLPTEPVMADGIKRGKGRVELSLDGQVLRFRLAARGQKNVVVGVEAPPV